MLDFHSVFMLLVCQVVPHCAYLNLLARKGEHFSTRVNKGRLFPGVEDVEVTVSLQDMPDMPTWLRLYQPQPNADAVLYGTPDHTATTVSLTVVGWNKETYSTAREIIMLSVLDRNVASNNTEAIELKVLGGGDYVDTESLLSIVRQLWPGVQHVSYVQKSTQRPDTGGRRGLFVGIRGNTPYPQQLKNLLNNCNDFNGAETSLVKEFTNAGFDIEWCSSRDTRTNPPPKPDTHFQFDENSAYFGAVLETTAWDDTTSDLSLDIAYVFIAVSVGLLLIAFITSIMFCHRDGLQPKPNEPRHVLLNHKTLRRVGAEIRNMSAVNNNPTVVGGLGTNGGFPYGKLESSSDDGAKNGTLSSNKSPASSPPPYRYNGVYKQDSQF